MLPVVSPSFFASNQFLPKDYYIPPPTRGMADHSTSNVRALFDTALQTYEKKVGVTLVEHPLAVQLQSCHSVESITTFLQDQVQAFNDFRESDRVIKSIKSTISILTKFSATASPALDIGLVRQTALMACSPDLTVFIAISTCENNTHWSRHPTCCRYRSLVSYIGTFVTPKRTRRPRPSQPAMTHSSTCSSPSKISLAVSISLH